VFLLRSVDLVLVALAFCVALFQGLTELQFTVIRISGRLGLAAALMALRATGLILGAGAGAVLFGTAQAVMIGLLFGQIAAGAAAAILDGSLRAWSPRRGAVTDLRDLGRYGVPAAGGAVLFLAALVVVRFVVVGRLGAASDEGAAFSMAYDLLQRPFNVLVAAIYIVTYPDVVSAYERGSLADARRGVSHLLEFVFCTTIIMLAGLVGFLPDIAWLFVPRPLLASFLAFSSAVALFTFASTHVQVSGVLVLLLKKETKRLFFIALGQLAMAPTLVWLSLTSGLGVEAALGVAVAGTLVWMGATSGPTLRFGAYPRAGLSFGAIGGAAVIAASALLPYDSLPWLTAKMAIALTVTALIAWAGDFLQLRQAAPSPK
jgi:hypothetical protein